MEAKTFPPSPNWYLSDVLCSGPNGEIIYGSRNTIVISTFNAVLNDTPVFPKTQIIEYAHKERITSVRFCPNVNCRFGKHFATAGDDSLVKLWDLVTMTPVIANFDHGDEKKVIGMDWSAADSNMIVSIDDYGGLVTWDIERNLTSKINLTKLLQMKKNSAVKVNVGKVLPLVIKCCPLQKDLVAIGMKGGLVCLLSVKDSGKVLHCMRGHDKDVTSLAWCPVPENISDENERNLMLASVCRDRLIYLWSAVDGRFQRTVKLPTTSFGRHSRLPASQTALVLNWPLEKTILCSSNYGEILRCDLSHGCNPLSCGGESTRTVDPTRLNSQWSLVHDIHSRGVFAIHTTKYSKEEDGKEKIIVWTTAQDRNLVAVTLEDGRTLANIPTIGGFVYCMASSPFDPSRIAIGLGDFSIRVWNTGNTKEVQINSIWQKIKGKVMAVAWHPTQEMKLAFGTHEGRVGIQDLVPGRLPVILVLRHRNSVYALSWGPPCYKEGEVQNLPQFCLYSCGDGEVIMYNVEEPDKEPRKMNLLLRGEEETKRKDNTCTDVAWKPDYSLLAIGNNDGTVQLFTPPYLKLVHTLYAHRKLLMNLTWHPLSTSSDTGLSNMRHCLATGANDHIIQVFDLTNLIKSVTAEEDFKGTIQSMSTLTGHQKKVVRLSWSPHTSGQICSASYDNTIRVWDVVHQTCIACFTGHLGAGLTCMWSPMDPDIIISGSADFTVCAWRISEAPFVPKSSSSTSQRKKTPIIKPTKAIENSNENVENLEKNIEKDDPVILLAKSTKDSETTKSSKSTWKGSLFPVSWKIAGGIGKVDGINQLLEKKENGSLGNLDEPSTTKLGFFGDREDMYNLLKKEEAHHLSQDNMEQVHLMGLWRGNVAEMVKDAIAKGTLSEWLLSIAPSASHKLWVEACQAYSEQLARYGKYNQAASYLLACHKVDDAIELLRSQMLYREAVAIARCRLGPEDPTAHKLILEWGKNLFTKGNYEVAAMCFTSIGEYLDAARALASRATLPECIALGATLALKAGEEGEVLAKILTMQCMHLNLLKHNWNAALECIEQVEELKPLSIVITLHEHLVKGYQECCEDNKGDLLRHWLLVGEKESSAEFNLSPLLQLPSLSWKSDSKFTAEEAYHCISNRRAEKVMNSEKNFMLELAEELALGVCAASSEGEVHGQEWCHVLKAMSLCYSYQMLGSDDANTSRPSLFHLLFMLSPNGPKDIHCLFNNLECEKTKGYHQSARAFCAFASAMWSEKYWSGETKEWPWSALASMLLSHLPDVLDPLAASYYKEEVEIHKREQELAKAKARLRIEKVQMKMKGAANQEVNNYVNEKEGVGKNEGVKNGNVEGLFKIKNNEDNVLKTNEAIADLEENKVEGNDESIAAKEVELLKLKERKELFEKNRFFAPNPFICVYKLRNVCDMIVKANVDEKNASVDVVVKLQDEISRTMSNL